MQQGFLRQLPFDWREFEMTPEIAAFFDDAWQHGVGEFGYSIPVTDRAGRRAIFSVSAVGTAKKWDRLVADNRSDWIELAYQIHMKAISEIHKEETPFQALARVNGSACRGWHAERIIRTSR